MAEERVRSLYPDEIAPGVPRFHPKTGAPMCACGKPAADCPETGWPHAWNPVDLGDDCVLCGNGIHPADDYERWGCGYAHHACVRGENEYEPVDEPLLWEGDW